MLYSVSGMAQEPNKDSLNVFPIVKADSIEEVIMEIDGQIVTAVISDNDTIFLASFDDVSISDFRSFETAWDYRRYTILRRYALVVYPYAVKAIKIFREQEYATKTMKKRKRKKYVKKLAKELKKEFEEPLKNLTKTQGKLLVKMIERELDKSMFNLLKDLRGVWTARWWNATSKLLGYDLKKAYKEGEDPILDAVLQDFNISYYLDEN